MSCLQGDALIFGSRGLLGSAIRREIEASGREVFSASVDWGDVRARDAHIRRSVDDLKARHDGCAVSVYWCAGSGVTSSDASAFTDEILGFEVLLRHLEWVGLASAATLFLASSAGALYAGAHHSPFSDESEPCPVMPYGWAKLTMEDALAEWAPRTGARAWSGRMSNLYGPGQDLEKPQGLISHALHKTLQGEALNIYVPLSTRRDYLYVDDCANMIAVGMKTLHAAAPGTLVKTLLCAGSALSISEVLAAIGASLGTPVEFTSRPSKLATGQAPDLTFEPSTWAGLDAVARTDFRWGIDVTLTSMLGELNESVARD